MKSKPCPKCGETMNRQSKVCWQCHKSSIDKYGRYVAVNCEKCGKSFVVHAATIERGYGKYCSRECARFCQSRRRKRVNCICIVCGKEFERHACELKKAVGSLRFCSASCWHQYNQGENHYGWTGGQNERMNPLSARWRKAVRKRDKGRCRLCGEQKELEAHHIRRFGVCPDLRWEVSNGMMLCKRCHLIFRRREEEFEELLTKMLNLPVPYKCDSIEAVASVLYELEPTGKE